jgi:hypothetical protein
MQRLIPLSVILVLLLSVCACSTGKNTPTIPPIAPSTSNSSTTMSQNSNRTIWGLWDVTISADRTKIDIIPMRSADMHFNAVRWLEVAPCQNCLSVSNLQPIPPNKLQVDVKLQHPFPGLLKYTGFDVRGVFISQADYAFQPSGRSIAWGDTVPRLLNPDGYTSLYNPTEFPPTQPAALGYIPGKKATGGNLSSTLNPFIAFKPDEPRRFFEAGSADTRNYKIQAPAGPIHFGYAVDVSWHPAENVIDPLTDFPLSANCLEAYQITVETGLVPTNGQPKMIGIKVLDHQGLDTIKSVSAYSPQLFDGEVTFNLYPGTGLPYALYLGSITDSLGAGPGTYPLLVRVVDMDVDPHFGQIDAWQVCPVEVSSVSKSGWVKTWGGPKVDDTRSLSVDKSGNIIVAGSYQEAVDFDPNDGVNEQSSNGAEDAFLSKFDSSGNLLWARTWGATMMDEWASAATDDSGYIYVTGGFGWQLDFDPGPGEEIHKVKTAAAYLSKFDPDGNFLWVKIWGGDVTHATEGFRVAVDHQGNPFVSGIFGDTVDFDPGPGIDNHTCNGDWNSFMSKFDPDGNFQWAITIGGKTDDMSLEMSFDLAGDVNYRGIFMGTWDFDPGPGVDHHTAGADYWNTFLSCLKPDGSYIGTSTWDGSAYFLGAVPFFDDSGNKYVAQSFSGTFDMDSGPGIDNHTSIGLFDAGVSKFDSNGNFLWARSWGGTGYDLASLAVADGSGNIYIEGGFEGLVDFDPGPETDYHESLGQYGSSLSKLDSNGNLIWARTWGAPDEWLGGLMVTDGPGNVYYAGIFNGLMDFDPTVDVEYRTSNGSWDCYLNRFPPDGNW